MPDVLGKINIWQKNRLTLSVKMAGVWNQHHKVMSQEQGRGSAHPYTTVSPTMEEKSLHYILPSDPVTPMDGAAQWQCCELLPRCTKALWGHCATHPMALHCVWCPEVCLSAHPFSSYFIQLNFSLSHSVTPLLANWLPLSFVLHHHWFYLLFQYFSMDQRVAWGPAYTLHLPYI